MEKKSPTAFLNSNLFCHPFLHTHRSTCGRRINGRHLRNVHEVANVRCRQAQTLAMRTSGSSSTSLSKLKSRLLTTLQGLDFGLTIDADAETMTEQEGEVFK